MGKHSPTIHEALAAIDQRLVKAKRAEREVELAYRRDQEATAAADKRHLDAQAARAAGLPSDLEEAAKELERTRKKALPARELEIARRAVELVEQERVAFLASHKDEFEQHFAEQYREAARKVEESEEAIVQAHAVWQDTNRKHSSFRHALGLSTHDVPQIPQPLMDSSRAIKRAREARAVA